ncbi:MAG TPA: hypothetical protein V6C81_26235 [Planktothrix sp.]|jgi:hypothetical protein
MNIENQAIQPVKFNDGKMPDFSPMLPQHMRDSVTSKVDWAALAARLEEKGVLPIMLMPPGRTLFIGAAAVAEQGAAQVAAAAAEAGLAAAAAGAVGSAEQAAVTGSQAVTGSGIARGAEAGTQFASDKLEKNVSSRIEKTGAKLYEMNHLDHRAADHGTADAMVLLPPNFDASKPMHLVVYDHGWYDTAKSAYDKANLAEQMAKAPANTVLIVPEWQQNAGSGGRDGGSNQGNFSKENFVSAMVQEIFNKTPELRGKTLADVDHIGIISHSAGYNPAESEIYKNGEFSRKVDSLTLLDSLYDGHGFDKWLNNNIEDLAHGKKTYQNIFNSTTAENSRQQLERVRQMLRSAHLPDDALSGDYKGASEKESMVKHPMMFHSTKVQHGEIPSQYPGMIMEASNEREWSPST